MRQSFANLIGAIISTHKIDPKFERLMLYAALEGNEIALLHMRQVTASIVDLFRNYFLRRQKQGHLRRHGPRSGADGHRGNGPEFALGKYVHEFKDTMHL